eukprot:5738296-Amphidinium_carterae.1
MANPPQENVATWHPAGLAGAGIHRSGLIDLACKHLKHSPPCVGVLSRMILLRGDDSHRDGVTDAA